MYIEGPALGEPGIVIPKIIRTEPGYIAQALKFAVPEGQLLSRADACADSRRLIAGKAAVFKGQHLGAEIHVHRVGLAGIIGPVHERRRRLMGCDKLQVFHGSVQADVRGRRQVLPAAVLYDALFPVRSLNAEIPRVMKPGLCIFRGKSGISSRQDPDGPGVFSPVQFMVGKIIDGALDGGKITALADDNQALCHPGRRTRIPEEDAVLADQLIIGRHRVFQKPPFPVKAVHGPVNRIPAVL